MRFFVPLLAVLCVVGCQQAPEAPATKSADPAKDAPKEAPKETKAAEPTSEGVVAAKDGSFTITLPKGWAPTTGDTPAAKEMKEKVLKTRPDMAGQMEAMGSMSAVLLIAMDSAKLEDKGDFVDNVNINVQDSQQTEWQDSNLAEVTKVLKEALSDPALSAGLVTVDGHKVLRYTATMKMGGASYQLVGYQYLHNKKVYTVTVSCGAGKLAEREKAFDTIATSLKFKA